MTTSPARSRSTTCVSAREAGVPFLLDACQSVGQMPVDVERIGCDLLTATGRKFLRGPRGTGFLYVRRGLIDQLEPPFLDLHAATRVTVLADRLRKQLSGRGGVHVHDQGVRRCGIVTFTVDGVPAPDVERRLHEHGVNVSVSLVEYARLDLQHRALPDLVRASVHYYNTDDELEQLIDALPPPR